MRRVAVTALEPTAGKLAGLLRAHGAQVVPVPVLEIQSVPLEVPSPPVDWLLLTSQQAVEQLGRQLGQQGQSFARFPRIAVVGAATAQALAQAGGKADFVPTVATGETLARELPLTPGASIWHPTSQQAGQAIGDILRARGAVYQRSVLYHTVGRVPSDTECTALRTANVITLASGSAAQAVAPLLGTAYPALVTLGPPTTRAAQALGLRVTQAAQPTLEALALASMECVLGDK